MHKITFCSKVASRNVRGATGIKRDSKIAILGRFHESSNERRKKIKALFFVCFCFPHKMSSSSNNVLQRVADMYNVALQKAGTDPQTVASLMLFSSVVAAMNYRIKTSPRAYDENTELGAGAGVGVVEGIEIIPRVDEVVVVAVGKRDEVVPAPAPVQTRRTGSVTAASSEVVNRGAVSIVEGGYHKSSNVTAVATNRSVSPAVVTLTESFEVEPSRIEVDQEPTQEEEEEVIENKIRTESEVICYEESPREGIATTQLLRIQLILLFFFLFFLSL